MSFWENLIAGLILFKAQERSTFLRNCVKLSTSASPSLYWISWFRLGKNLSNGCALSHFWFYSLKDGSLLILFPTVSIIAASFRSLKKDILLIMSHVFPFCDQYHIAFLIFLSVKLLSYQKIYFGLTFFHWQQLFFLQFFYLYLPHLFQFLLRFRLFQSH